MVDSIVLALDVILNRSVILVDDNVEDNGQGQGERIKAVDR